MAVDDSVNNGGTGTITPNKPENANFKIATRAYIANKTGYLIPPYDIENENTNANRRKCITNKYISYVNNPDYTIYRDFLHVNSIIENISPSFSMVIPVLKSLLLTII